MACAFLIFVAFLSALGPAAVSAATTITYTRDALALARIWVNTTEFEILGGTKAPKFTGSAVSAGIIRWDATDDHFIRRTSNVRAPVSAVLSTGDVKWAISKTPYRGGDVVPSYPSIPNSNIPGSRDSVVLDFWVRATGRTQTPYEDVVQHIVHAASNEGSPAAIKLHGTGPKDMFHVEINGVIKERKSFERIWDSPVDCEDVCRPPQPGQKMHYFAAGKYYQGLGPFRVPYVRGREYRVKVRLADTSDRLVDSVLYLHTGRFFAEE